MKTLYYGTIDNGSKEVRFKSSRVPSLIEFVKWYLRDYMGIDKEYYDDDCHFAAFSMAYSGYNGMAGFFSMTDFFTIFSDYPEMTMAVIQIKLPKGCVKVVLEREWDAQYA